MVVFGDWRKEEKTSPTFWRNSVEVLTGFVNSVWNKESPQISAERSKLPVVLVLVLVQARRFLKVPGSLLLESLLTR